MCCVFDLRWLLDKATIASNLATNMQPFPITSHAISTKQLKYIIRRNLIRLYLPADLIRRQWME